MKKWYHYLMLATLTLGLWLVSSQAFAHEFKLTNRTSGTIYGRCGTSITHGITSGHSRAFSCPGQLIVLVWNNDDANSDPVGSHTFGCTDGQDELLAVSSVSPYSFESECQSSSAMESHPFSSW